MTLCFAGPRTETPSNRPEVHLFDKSEHGMHTSYTCCSVKALQGPQHHVVEITIMFIYYFTHQVANATLSLIPTTPFPPSHMSKPQPFVQ